MIKRDNIIMITGLVIAGIAVIFLIVFLILVLNRDAESNSNINDSETTYGGSSLQMSQRNDARKRDVSNVVQATVNYTANNNAPPNNQDVPYKNGLINTSSKFGNYFDNMSSFTENVYVYQPHDDKPIEDFSSAYLAGDVGDVTPSLRNITVILGQTCVTNTRTKVANSKRQSAVVVQLETADNEKRYYCQNASW